MKHPNNIDSLFDIVISRFDPMIRRICHGYSTNRASASDLYQEIMVALWLGLKSFEGRAALSTWVYRVSINACISFLRRVDRNTLLGLPESIENIADEIKEDHDEEKQYLEFLIEHLSPIDKAIVLLWLDDRSYAEISEIVGVSRNVVGTRLSRIRGRFKKQWQNNL